MSKHIIGKVYDVTAASINKLIAELEELKTEQQGQEKYIARLTHDIGAYSYMCAKLAKSVKHHVEKCGNGFQDELTLKDYEDWKAAQEWYGME